MSYNSCYFLLPVILYTFVKHKIYNYGKRKEKTEYCLLSWNLG